MPTPHPSCRARTEGGRHAAATGPSAVEQDLNNMIEQDHRRVKQRTIPMLGFKWFDHAAVTISGIELVQKIQKHQLKTGKLGVRSAAMPERWNAVLAA